MVKFKISSNVIITAVDENDAVRKQYRDKHVLQVEKGERSFLINDTVKYFIDKFSIPKTTAEVLKEIQADVKSDSPEIEKTCAAFFNFLGKGKVLVPEDYVETDEPIQPLFKEGDFIDQFRVKSVLSIRRFNELYIATDTTSDTDVVIKLLNSKKTANTKVYEEELSELEREYKMLRNVRHIPQISQAFSWNKEHDSFVYFALEHIPGKSLSHYFDEDAKPGKAVSLHIISQMLQAFSSLHNSNFIHGDVHASNILVTKDKSVKVIDLGMSAKIEAEETEIVPFGGVDFYMPPERINVTSIHKYAKKPDLYSDVYQLGILMYFILYNKFPFDGFIWEELAANIKESRPEFSKRSFSNFLVPGKLVQIIEKCIHKNPADRYHNASEILADFEKLVLKRKEQLAN